LALQLRYVFLLLLAILFVSKSLVLGNDARLQKVNNPVFKPDRRIQAKPNGLSSCSPGVPSDSERSPGNRATHDLRRNTNRHAVPSPERPCDTESPVTGPRCGPGT
jgi:hypothetical protein